MKNTEDIIDRIICIIVFLQPILVIFQIILIDVFYIPQEVTTSYRVVLTAVPMLIAIALSFFRSSFRWVMVYFIVLIILLIEILIFPQNLPFIIEEGFRFTIPIVIPSALCLISVRNIMNIEKSLYIISWGIFILTIFYVVNIIGGVVSFEGYNMAFSYALLLPMICFYSRKNVLDIVISFFLLLVVFAIGSRGSAIVFFIYILIDSIFLSRKNILKIVLLISVLVSLSPIFIDFLDKVGISSRTLYFLEEGNIGSDTGRNSIYKYFVNVVLDNPWLGVGIFGDRYTLGAMCHNIILELYVDWGFLLGTFILSFFIIKLSIVFINLNKFYKMMFVKYSIALVVPLMVSGSYLTDYFFGIYIGIIYLISTKQYKFNGISIYR